MNGQYLCNRQITVSYAYKKDTKGERHGTPAGKNCLLIFELYEIFLGYEQNSNYCDWEEKVIIIIA